MCSKLRTLPHKHHRWYPHGSYILRQYNMFHFWWCFPHKDHLEILQPVKCSKKVKLKLFVIFCTKRGKLLPQKSRRCCNFQNSSNTLIKYYSFLLTWKIGNDFWPLSNPCVAASLKAVIAKKATTKLSWKFKKKNKK